MAHLSETEYSAAAQTDGATPLDMLEIPLDEHANVYVTAHCVARQERSGDTKAWNLSFAAKRDTGDASLVAAVVDVVTPIGSARGAAWVVTAIAAGASVWFRVTGELATLIDWHIRAKALLVAT
jgi:hypothetical protein